MPPTIVITRPEPQASRFGAALQKAHGAELQTLIAPMIAIEAVPLTDPITPPDHVIFTSASAVSTAVQLQMAGKSLAWCVGPQTATAAKTAGFQTMQAGGSSADLVKLLLERRPEGTLLHMRGTHTTGQIAQTLTKAGLRCTEIVVYAQVAQPMPEALKALLASDDSVILPLFSPRSAQLLGESAAIGRNVSVIAISDAVSAIAADWPVKALFTANSPDKNAMISATLRLYDALCFPKTT